MKWNVGASRSVELSVPLLLLLVVARVHAVEQRLIDRHSHPAAASLVDGDDPGRRGQGAALVPPPWETDEGDTDEDGISDRHEHRLRLRNELVKSIKENILKSLGRTGTTAAGGGGGRKGPTLPGHVTASAAADSGAEEVSVVQVKKIIAFSNIPGESVSVTGVPLVWLRAYIFLHP